MPYTYTLARRAHDTGLPITGGLYLQWPGQPAAYEHPSEYTFGSQMVVAPVIAPGDPAPATVWVPPGNWVRGSASATRATPTRSPRSSAEGGR